MQRRGILLSSQLHNLHWWCKAWKKQSLIFSSPRQSFQWPLLGDALPAQDLTFWVLWAAGMRLRMESLLGGVSLALSAGPPGSEQQVPPRIWARAMNGSGKGRFPSLGPSSVLQSQTKHSCTILSPEWISSCSGRFPWTCNILPLKGERQNCKSKTKQRNPFCLLESLLLHCFIINARSQLAWGLFFPAWAEVLFIHGSQGREGVTHFAFTVM